MMMHTDEINALSIEERFVFERQRVKILIHRINAAFIFVSLASFMSAGAFAKERDALQMGIPEAKLSRETITIAPGKVKFSIYPDGQWESFVPAWTAGKGLIIGGSFIFFGRRGEFDEVFSAGLGKRSTPHGSFFQAGFFEGCTGGRRKPAAYPDDDKDGLVDEDSPDGKDNDGDGLVDEDFAAIGDEMAVIEYVESSADSSVKLLFHEECYAWSLPNIARMAFLSLRVKNIGTEAVSLPGLGAYFQLPGSAFLNKRTIESSIDPSMKGTMVACRSAEGVIGMMFFSPKEKKLMCGWTENGEELLSLLGSNSPEEEALYGEVMGEDSKGLIMTTDEAVIFGIGERGDTLHPGGEVEMGLALVCARDAGEMENAIIEAFKTFIGDGENRLVPPPVAMERKILWGSYKIVKGLEEKVLITVEEGGSLDFSVDKVSFLSFVPLARVKSLAPYGGEVSFVYNGNIPAEALDAAGRVSLLGKLKDGTFFELLLRPKALNSNRSGNSALGRFNQAAEYFAGAGRLPEKLLSSSPNPFRENTTIYYEVPQRIQDGKESIYNTEGAMRTQVKVYSVDGRLVSILVDELLGPGLYSTQWGGVDDNGSPVASGIYYVKLQIEKRHVTKRLTYLK